MREWGWLADSGRRAPASGGKGFGGSSPSGEEQVPGVEHHHLEWLSAWADVSRGEIVRAAFDEYVRRHGKKVRLELLRHGWNLFAEEAADEVETARHELDDQAPDREI